MRLGSVFHEQVCAAENLAFPFVAVAMAPALVSMRQRVKPLERFVESCRENMGLVALAGSTRNPSRLKLADVRLALADKTSTVVLEFKLESDRWRRSTVPAFDKTIQPSLHAVVLSQISPMVADAAGQTVTDNPSLIAS